MSWVTLDTLIDNHYLANPLGTNSGGTGLDSSGAAYNYLISDGEKGQSYAPVTAISRTNIIKTDTENISNYVAGEQAVVNYSEIGEAGDYYKKQDPEKYAEGVPDLKLFTNTALEFFEYNGLVIKYMDCCNPTSPVSRRACGYSGYELHPDESVKKVSDSEYDGTEQVFCESRLLDLNDTSHEPLIACRYITLHKELETEEGIKTKNTIYISNTKLTRLNNPTEWVDDINKYADTLVPMKIFFLH